MLPFKKCFHYQCTIITEENSVMYNFRCCYLYNGNKRVFFIETVEGIMLGSVFNYSYIEEDKITIILLGHVQG